MQKQTSIYIPKPCNEDWNKMTPTQQGKFCSACNKQVVDFSLMSDNQILKLLSNQSGKLCGRFDADQLQRPLVETKIKKKKSWWMAFTMPLLFLFDKSEAQREVYINEDSAVDANAIKSSLQKSPFDLEYYPSKQITIAGKVLDDKHKPIYYATIIQKGTNNGTVSDSNGNFSIKVNTDEDSITLTTSYIGFSPIEKSIKPSDKNINGITINMKEQIMGLGEVVVTVGLVSVCHHVKMVDTLHATTKKLFGTTMFNLYPNPVSNNGIVHLQIKSSGSYQMQLLDIQSRLIQTEEINVDAKNTITQIQLQSNIAAGMYYLRLINEQTKKQYTEKLIIQ